MPDEPAHTRAWVPLGVIGGVVVALVTLVFTMHERTPHQGSWTRIEQTLHEQVVARDREDIRLRLDRLEAKVDSILERLPKDKLK